MNVRFARLGHGRTSLRTLVAAASIAGCLLAAGATLLSAQTQQPGGMMDSCPDCGIWRMDQRMCPMGWAKPVVTVAPAELPDADSEGAQAFVRYCGQCHGLPSPRSHSAAEWGTTLTSMQERIRARSPHGGGSRDRWEPNALVPTEDDATNIRGYLEGHSLRSAPEQSLDKSKPGASAFARVCAKCHALPDPAQHTSSEWPAVVERMKGNMVRMNVGALTDEDRSQIVAFLGAKP